MAQNYLALVDNLPQVSPLTMQMLRVLSKTNCSVSELTNIAERDATLSARILRTANSATFARLEPVRSLRHAISIQGVNVLRKFMLGASVANLFSRKKGSQLFSMHRFNHHSVAVGTLLEVLTEVLPMEDSGQAFVTGLLHDAGEMLIAQNCAKEYEQILGLCAVTGEPQSAGERQILGIDHMQLSALAVRKWQLDTAIARAFTASEDLELEPGSKYVPLGYALKVANRFVDGLGISVLPPAVVSPGTLDLAFPGFSFDKTLVATRFDEEWAKIREMFQ